MKTDILKLVYSTSFMFGIFIARFVRGQATTTTDPKKYVISLDLPPEQRWTHVVKDYSKEIKEVIMEFRYVRVCLVSRKIDVSVAVITDSSVVIYHVFCFCLSLLYSSPLFSVDDHLVGKELTMLFVVLCYSAFAALCLCLGFKFKCINSLTFCSYISTFF